MDADRLENNNFRYQTRPNNNNWHYSGRKTRRYNQNDYSESRPEHSSYNRYDNTYYQNNSWKRRGLHKYSGNRVYNNQSIQERSTFEWMKHYESMLWDTYEDVKLDSINQKETTNNDNLRFFSNFQNDAKNEDIDFHEIPEEIIVQQKRLLDSRKNSICIRCLKIHPKEHCRKARCQICSSRFHHPQDCPWKTDPDHPIRLCESCNGGNYYLNSRLDFSTYRRPVCSNHNDKNNQDLNLEMPKNISIHPCIKKGYEESILAIGDHDYTEKITNLDIECYNCSGFGHIICNNEIPFKNAIKKAYCALCGNPGHNYQLCNRFNNVRLNENFSGYHNLGNSQYFYLDENDQEDYESNEETNDNEEEDNEEEGNNEEKVEGGGYKDERDHEKEGKRVKYYKEDSFCESDYLEEYMESDYDDDIIDRASVSSLRKATSRSCDSTVITRNSRKTKRRKQRKERMSNASKSIERDFSLSERSNSICESSASDVDEDQTNEMFYTKYMNPQTEDGVNPFHKFQRARIYYKNKSLFKLMGNCNDHNYNENNDCDDNNNDNNNYDYYNYYHNKNLSESKDKSTSVRSKNIHKSRKKSRRPASRSRRKK
ncbi:Uncharacterized protein with CCHC-type Zinc finger [Cryptosporidium hominis]|uniref:Uncharacterized protein with CCHC-type Zinc finger n=2 Tax=Cryptosporidium hominis TaxID=237895 RepID=A0ABX5BKC2_CRYHO|nr:Uncharacterized protein with CCHC-type Zinc finger [Cryptosporidium hominis]|eukprot:PPS98246.1 Uncharacterized protein with CCHC-type Zinc finger [Cryptosporidium hominis]